MLSVKISGKAYQIPTGWHEITWKQYLQMLEPLKITDLISIFTRIPRKKLLRSKIQGLETLIVALDFVGKGMDIPEHPYKLGKYDLPKDITLQTIEQYSILQTEIEKSGKEETILERTKYVANFAAIYCQALNEDFDYDKSIALAKEFDNYSCIEVMAAGSFFLHKLTAIDKHLPMSYLLTLTRWKKLNRDSRNSIKRSGSTPRSTKSRGMSKKMTKRSRNGA